MRDRGFTLIEAIAVVGLLGVLFAISAPLYMKAKDNAEQSLNDSRINPQQCAADVLANHGIGLTDLLENTTIPVYIQEQVISQCLLPALTPANGQQPSLGTP